MQCPFCKEEIQEGAAKCKHCGSMLKDVGQPIINSGKDIFFKNPKTGETKKVKVGFSWILFLFSGFIGIPLFLRGLHVWGGIMAGLWALNLIGGQQITIGLFFVALGLGIFLGIKGNAMTAKNYLEKGWIVANPDSDAVRMATMKWGIRL